MKHLIYGILLISPFISVADDGGFTHDNSPLTSSAIRDLSNLNPEKRKAAMKTLREMKPTDPTIYTKLVEIAEMDSDLSVRREASYTLQDLSLINPHIHTTFLKLVLLDSDQLIRQNAAIALGNSQSVSPKIQIELLKAFSDSEPGVREIIAWAFGKMKSSVPAVHTKLLEVIQIDSNPRVLWAAAEALEKCQSVDYTIYIKLAEIVWRSGKKTLATNWVLKKIDPAHLKAIKIKYPRLCRRIFNTVIKNFLK